MSPGEKPPAREKTAAELYRVVVEADLSALCKRHRIDRRRTGLNVFRNMGEKWQAVKLLHEAERYKGCLPEFLGLLKQDAPLPDAGSFIAILHEAVQYYKKEAGEK